MTTHVPLHFTRTTGLGVHDDLLLRLGAWWHACDSYYLGLDDSPTMGADIGSGLVRLLDQWLEQLDRLPAAEGPAFLPFDFSDQCTGWLRVSSVSAERVVVEAGWSAVEGWSFYPSDIAETAAGLADFEPIENTAIACELDALLLTVAGIRAGFAA
ncbi:hypothetical protein ACIRD3_03665 [Kitasatospora sp. NPDC093550]|uniref:hypothetical protein n=1 Tax=Kitasatospora sp. NPDC093550 TaxID=3364089 RepID=UPI00380363B1